MRSTEPALRAALDQGAGRSGDADDGLARLERVARAAADAGADLLIGSECSLTGYNLGARTAELAEPLDGPIGRSAARIAADAGIALVYGQPERDGGAVYNTVRLVGADGTPLAAYRKAHLFGDLDRDAFRPGCEAVVQAELRGVRVGLLICYDVEFPEAVRAHALAGTELLAVPTALMHPHTGVATALVPVRAMESQLYLAYVNRCDTEGALDYCGLSTLVAPDGTEAVRAGAGEELLVADLHRSALEDARGATTYLRDRRPDLYGSLAV
ncbi:carbon-nitrogen hydrolase family protein [Nocardiopsis chromatogenes]|uniref:carbon-nitrogen hydrolase family protein n=1 Tax=Nocardiopsis chromatogenes TaxID=280239 RepID=UPI0003752205|nr:carbon-nitrogen hydrolase family protein [Nocardiopsis chromatogenes]